MAGVQWVMSLITVTPGHYIVTPSLVWGTVYNDRMPSMSIGGLFSPVTVDSTILSVMRRLFLISQDSLPDSLTLPILVHIGSTLFTKSAMFANLFQNRLKHTHTRVPQRDSESPDSDTLLPSDPSTASISLKASALDRSGRDIRVAVKTLLLSTAVYLGVGLCLAYGARNAAVFTNVDDFCMRHVSRYCKNLQ
jgi:hypothetical protein